MHPNAPIEGHKYLQPKAKAKSKKSRARGGKLYSCVGSMMLAAAVVTGAASIPQQAEAFDDDWGFSLDSSGSKFDLAGGKDDGSAFVEEVAADGRGNIGRIGDWTSGGLRSQQGAVHTPKSTSLKSILVNPIVGFSDSCKEKSNVDFS